MQSRTAYAVAKNKTVSQATLSRILKGKMNPSLDVIEGIAQGLGVDPLDLLIDDTKQDKAAFIQVNRREYNRVNAEASKWLQIELMSDLVDHIKKMTNAQRNQLRAQFGLSPKRVDSVEFEKASTKKKTSKAINE